MKLNVNDRFFAKARPVWAKGLEEEKTLLWDFTKKQAMKREKPF